MSSSLNSACLWKLRHHQLKHASKRSMTVRPGFWTQQNRHSSCCKRANGLWRLTANLLSQPRYRWSQCWCWKRSARSSPKPWSPATAIADEASKKDFKDILSLNHRTLLVADPHRCKSTKFGGAGARARYQKSTAIPLDTNRGGGGKKV